MRVRSFVLLALAACSAPPSANDSRHWGGATFSVGSPPASAAMQGPFVSVIDSLYLGVTGSDGSRLVFAKRLARRDESASFPLELPDGQASFDVRLVSTTAVGGPRVLFDQLRTVDIRDDGFNVQLEVVARASVLVAVPDTLQLIVPAGPASAPPPRAVLNVHNRGRDSLAFVIYDTTAHARSQCHGACVSAILASGSPNGSAVYNIIAVATFTSPITLWIESPQGDVPVVVRPP